MPMFMVMSVLERFWPSNEDIREVVDQVISAEMYRARYANVFEGTKEWQAISTSGGMTYNWNDGSTYVQNPPYFEGSRERCRTPQ